MFAIACVGVLLVFDVVCRWSGLELLCFFVVVCFAVLVVLY